jgi:hypothetical protein
MPTKNISIDRKEGVLVYFGTIRMENGAREGVF